MARPCIFRMAGIRSLYFSCYSAVVGLDCPPSPRLWRTSEAEHMETPRERVISITLNETEWLAFVRLHPQPVTWLRERIQESIAVEPAISGPLSATGGAN